MSRKHNHIERLTPELMKAYQAGTLSADEMYAVEKFLLENPFEAEALEGLEMTAPADLDGHMDDLNARLTDKLAEDHETRVVFWTMTRKIAATLLILMAAGFFLFKPAAPDLPTKELTQASNKTEEPGKEPAVDTSALDKADTDARESLTVENESTAEEKQEDTRAEDDDVDNETSGWFDSNKLQTNAETTSDLSLDKVKTEVDGKGLVASQTFALSGARAEENTINLSDSATKAFDTELITSLPPAAPQKAQTTSVFTEDSLPGNVGEKSIESLLQGKVAGVQTESRSTLRTDFRPKNSLLSDSVQGVESSLKFIRGQAKIRENAFTVSGVVMDEQGSPLPGVQVQIKGTSIGMHTDIKGAYSLGSAVAIGSVLFRYLGYATQEREVKGKKEINVEMIPDVSSLGEVVVSDYAPPQPPDEEEVVRNYNPARPVYGQKAFTRHVKENLIYPKEAAAQKIRGRVLVEFTVTAEGDLKDIKVLKGLGYGCDEEAVRLVKTGPRWQARRTGIDRSTPVDSKVRVRIRFKP